MKKILSWVLSIGVIVALVICGIVLHKPTNPSVSVDLNGIDVNTTIATDYAAINDSNAVFYESQITLENVLDSTYSATVVNVVNIFQLADTSYQFIHELKDSVVVDSVVKVNDFWMEDCNINFMSIIPLSIALDAVANSTLYPNVHVITLRSPLGPNVTNPYYIFGKVTSVDAVTEEVMTTDEMFEKIFHVVEEDVTVLDSVVTDSVVIDTVPTDLSLTDTIK